VNTYEFVSGWVKQRLAGRRGSVLDYGCGAGQIIELLRAAGVDAWGCDVFYEGGDYSTQIPAELQPFIRRITDVAIPYEDGRFDIVLSNQVFEHVPDMEQALREIARVLKPGGTALNVFPDHGVWREGHCGIPFLHWFPKGTQPRVYYAACLRSLGLGNYTAGKSIMRWSRDFCDWLDLWTYYRPRAEIHERLNRVIGATVHAEEQWLSARFEGHFDALPTGLQRLIVRKMAGLTLVSVKAAAH
jgi:SAM-dependent methyltransferase